jgi:hypothetical protein
LLIFLAALIPTAVKADHLIMSNGDLITGKVTRVTEQEVTINPEYAKKFSVKASAVASIVTDEPLEVEMADGRRIEARFAGLEEGRQMLLIEEEAVPVDFDELYKAARPQAFYHRESLAEGQVVINEGNTQSRSSIFKFDTRLRLGEHRQYAQLAIRRDENNGKSTKKQTFIRYEYDWLFRRDWYLGGTSVYERDPVRDLSHRFTLGVLLGHDFVDRENIFLTIKAGGGYTDEKLGEVPASGPVGLWELEYKQGLRGGDLELFHEHALTYQHYEDNNVIVKSNTGLRFDILWDIYATASYRFNYESEPAPGRFGKDSTLGFGLGAKF